MAQDKDFDYYIELYEEMFGELPPARIRDDSGDRLQAMKEAIDSGVAMPPEPILDPRIRY